MCNLTRGFICRVFKIKLGCGFGVVKCFAKVEELLVFSKIILNKNKCIYLAPNVVMYIKLCWCDVRIKSKVSVIFGSYSDVVRSTFEALGVDVDCGKLVGEYI